MANEKSDSGMNRRRFLGFTAGAAAGTAVGVPVSRTLSDFVASMNPPVYPPEGPEDFVLSICGMCPGGCGARARRIGGRVVKLDGNPLHPVNKGRLCPKGQAALQALYHPDRFAGPLRRTGDRGSLDSFEPTSWDEALDEIAARLKPLREEGHPDRLILMRGASHGISSRLARRFMKAFGSPNDVSLYRGDDTAAMALDTTQGIHEMPVYDVQSAEYILSFGSALLEASPSPVNAMHAYGDFRQGRAGRRGKFVQVESRLSMTGAAADEWVAVRPGTEGVFALGVANVLLAESLYNRQFVDEQTLDVEDYQDQEGNLREGLRTLIEGDYSLERVSNETGVPVNTILRIGREFAASRGPLAVGPRKGPSLPGSPFDHLTAHWLNALMGNVDQPGGILVSEDVPLNPWPELPDDPVAAEGLTRPRFDGSVDESVVHHSYPDRLADVLLAEYPYPIEVLILSGADPVFAGTDGDRLAAAVETVPLVISMASIPDDTALLADFILPEPHFLERWEFETTPAGVGFPLVSLARPAIEPPLVNARHSAQVFLDLAKRLGGAVSDAFPWKDVGELIREEVDGLYDAQRGAVMGTSFDEAWVRMMERAGWWAPGYGSADELWDRMIEAGGWWDPFYDHSNWRRVLRTPSGRFEFRTDVLRRLAEKRSEASPPATENETGESGLVLLLFEPLPIAGGTGAELPFLQELLDPAHQTRWETWVELNPETAAELGVGHRDTIRVRSEHGSIVAKAQVTERVVPGAAAIPLGLGHREGGRWGRGIGANPLQLLAPEYDPIGVGPPGGGTLVELTLLDKAAGGRPPEGQV